VATPPTEPPAARNEPTTLGGLATFADSLARVPWFAACGEDLTSGERQEVRDYLVALGLTADIALAGDWRSAEAVTRDPRWDTQWWDAEERLRLGLLSSAQAQWGEHALMTALTRITDAATQMTLGAASSAAARQGIADPALARVAAGAATQAAYQAALARAAGQDGAHPFAIKFRLFAAGRWLLGLVGGVFHVF
jgi:hypothetical protein